MATTQNSRPTRTLQCLLPRTLPKSVELIQCILIRPSKDTSPPLPLRRPLNHLPRRADTHRYPHTDPAAVKPTPSSRASGESGAATPVGEASVGLGSVNGTSQTRENGRFVSPVTRRSTAEATPSVGIIISTARGWISDGILGVSDSRMRLPICKGFTFLVGHENTLRGETWYRACCSPVGARYLGRASIGRFKRNAVTHYRYSLFAQPEHVIVLLSSFHAFSIPLVSRFLTCSLSNVCVYEFTPSGYLLIDGALSLNESLE